MSGFSRWGQMSERKQFRAIKGTRDILPPDSARWNWFEHTAREVFESYNFGEIRLPIFEETEVFARALGADTDVVSKEMFTFPDPPVLSDAQFRAGWEKLKELAVACDPALGAMAPGAQETILSQSRQWTLAAYTSIRWGIEEAIKNSASLRPEATASVCRA